MKNAETVDHVIDFLTRIIAEETGGEAEKINVDTEFIEFGLDSINSLVLLEKAENHFGVEMNPLYFWDYPTIRSFAQHIFDSNK